MATNNNVVLINLGGRDREVRFGHKALKTYQAISGVSIEELGNGTFDLETIEKLMYCGLLTDARKHGETLNLEDMEDYLDEIDTMGEVVEKMTEALTVAFGSGDNGVATKNARRTAARKK